MHIPHRGNVQTVGAISDDGTLVAVGANRMMGNNDEDADATIYSTATGEKICEIPTSVRERDADYMGFAGNQNLLIASRATGARKASMEVWDTHSGKLLRRFPCNFMAPAGTSVTPDGRFVAMADWQHVQVYSIETGTQVSSMPAPSEPPTGITNGNDPRVHGQPVPFMNVDTLAFSPDGGMLAGTAGMGNQPIVCWNNEGKVAENVLLTTDGRVQSNRPYIQWSPDGASWLVGQHCVVDHKSARDRCGQCR